MIKGSCSNVGLIALWLNLLAVPTLAGESATPSGDVGISQYPRNHYQTLGFRCPDSKALKLAELALEVRNWMRPSNQIPVLESILSEASRPMDQDARIYGCRVLFSALMSDHFACQLGRCRENPLRASDVERLILIGRLPELCRQYLTQHSATVLPTARGKVHPTEAMIANGITGVVKVRLKVSAAGEVLTAEVIEGSHPELYEPSRQAAMQFVYLPEMLPALQGGATSIEEWVITSYSDLAEAASCPLG